MPSTSYRMPRSLIASALVLALCSCANTPALIHPPLADLKPAAEPVIPAEALTSAAALDAFDIAHEAWGRGEHAKIVRLCRWYRDMGLKQLIC